MEIRRYTLERPWKDLVDLIECVTMRVSNPRTALMGADHGADLSLSKPLARFQLKRSHASHLCYTRGLYLTGVASTIETESHANEKGRQPA